MNKKDTYFGARLFVISLLVATLIVSIVTATSIWTLLTSILLFLLPMVLDYYSQIPVLQKNIRRKELILWISAGGSTITIGTILITIILAKPTPIIIEAGFTWWKVLISLVFVGYIAVAIFDWIGYSSPEELDHRKKMRKLAQKRAKKFQESKKTNTQIISNPSTN